MARFTGESVRETILPYLKEGEHLKNWAVGMFAPKALFIIVAVVGVLMVFWSFLFLPLTAGMYARYGPLDPRAFLSTMLVLSPFLIILVVSMNLLMKTYAIGLTGDRLLAVRFRGKLKVKEVTEYPLATLAPSETNTGPLNTTIKIHDQWRPFSIKCHRAAMTDNRSQAQAIGEKLSGTRVTD